ncbi:MAG: hypothetical protein KAV00_08965 [Phycisphaerae bacterium]|nr:hypothetical protein [Phycisphaerae bacterium]
MSKRPNLVKENILEFKAYLTHIVEKADATGEFRRRWKAYKTIENVMVFVGLIVGLAAGVLVMNGIGGRIGGGGVGFMVGGVIGFIVADSVYGDPLKTSACFTGTRSRFLDLLKGVIRQQPTVDLAVGAAMDWHEEVHGAFGMLINEFYNEIPECSLDNAHRQKQAIQETLRLGTGYHARLVARRPDDSQDQAVLLVIPSEFTACVGSNERPSHTTPASRTKRTGDVLVVKPENLPDRYEAAMCILSCTAVFVVLAVLNVKGMTPLWCVVASVTALVGVLMTGHRRFVFDPASGTIRKQTVIYGMALTSSEYPFEHYDEIRVEPYRRTENQPGKSGASKSRTVTRFRVEMVRSDGALRIPNVISREKDALALAEAVRTMTQLPVRVDKETFESQMEQERRREAARSPKRSSQTEGNIPSSAQAGSIPYIKPVDGVKHICGSLVVDPDTPWYVGSLLWLFVAGYGAVFALLNLQGTAPLCWLLVGVLVLAAGMMSYHHRLVFDRANRKIHKQTKLLGMVLAVSESSFDGYDKIVIEPYRSTSTYKGSSGVYRTTTYVTSTNFRVAVISGDHALEIRDCGVQEDATALAEAVQLVMLLPVELELDKIQSQLAREKQRQSL